MKTDEIRDRLNDLVLYSRMTKSGFAKRCNVDASSFLKMISGEHSVTIRTIEKICAAFPEVNYNWLVRGDGEMLKSPIFHQIGDNNTAVGHNSTVNSSDALTLAISELAAQRRVTEKVLEQNDKLISLLRQTNP